MQLLQSVVDVTDIKLSAIYLEIAITKI